MPIIPVLENDNRYADPSLIMGEPLIWNTDTLTGTCKGLAFDQLLNGDGRLTDEDLVYLESNNRTPFRYSIFAIRGSIVYLRLFFNAYDHQLQRSDPRNFYMKARNLDFWLAFLMGTHTRLGEESEVRNFPHHGDSNILDTIFRQL